MKTAAAWERLRYGALRHVAARNRAAGATYSRLVAGVESRLHPERTRLATARIVRALGTDAATAHETFRQCLASEALEEADTAWLVRSAKGIDSLVRRPQSEAPHRGPCIYVSLHFGSPILTFLYLRTMQGIAVRAIGRPLDADNPLSPAKGRWGREKVAWVSSVSDTTFLGIDGRGMLDAREELLDGRSLYVVVDVPGDIVSRSAKFNLFGETVLFSSGVLRLAQLTGVPLVPVLGHSDGRWVDIEFSEPIHESSEAATRRSLNDWMEAVLLRSPGQWWMWPFLSGA